MKKRVVLELRNRPPSEVSEPGCCLGCAPPTCPGRRRRRWRAHGRVFVAPRRSGRPKALGSEAALGFHRPNPPRSSGPTGGSAVEAQTRGSWTVVFTQTLITAIFWPQIHVARIQTRVPGPKTEVWLDPKARLCPHNVRNPGLSVVFLGFVLVSDRKCASAASRGPWIRQPGPTVVMEPFWGVLLLVRGLTRCYY